MKSEMDEQGCEENDGIDLDPRIQVELEKLNSATNAINSLEVELDEANTAFRMLLNDSTRRLKALSKRLGSCIERARPYYDALEEAKLAQLDCQHAAVQFRKANEIHQAAKETVALAEQRFLSKQHEWQFDNAWQEMLNHATIKVMEAETAKTESEREHQRLAALYNEAGQKLQLLESKLWRTINKSRPYFEEKELCQNQLATQKERVDSLQAEVTAVKRAYACSLKQLEAISLEIHRKRGDVTEEEDAAPGIREPGVGAEEEVVVTEEPYPSVTVAASPTVVESKFAKISPTAEYSEADRTALHKLLPNLNRTVDKLKSQPSGSSFSELDYELELDRCDLQSLGSTSAATSSAVSDDDCIEDDSETEELKAMAAKQTNQNLQVPNSAMVKVVNPPTTLPGTPRKTDTFDSVRKLSENWERQMGETINRWGTMLTLRPKQPEICSQSREKY